MSLLPYTIIDPVGAASPLIVDAPHSGRIYPVDFAYACPLHLLRQAEDSYVDEVIAGAAEAGATVIAAEFPRSMIDVNRAENDLDPAALEGEWPQPVAPDEMTLAGYGLVRRLCRNGVALYTKPLTVAEVRRRIEVYYKPYHECLRSRIAARLAQFGECVLIDAHSMPDRIENGVARPDFVLGDRDGTSCDPALTGRAQCLLQDMGYSVTLNTPYKGREIVRRYGVAGQGAQALQIEINRRLYLNELTIEKNAGFDKLRRDMTAFFHRIAASIETAERLAAE
jgi:N-formylglutamate amidohydrolase